MFLLLFITASIIGAANLTDVSYYEIIGVSKQASAQEIRQAYKKLAIKLHPDKNPNEQEKFLKITEAYETLKDPEKRQNYDRYGSYQSYSRRYDYRSQSEYDNLYYNGLYHNDPFVDTLSGTNFYNYLNEGFYFINFYSPFCPPCQNVADHWKKLAEMYKGIVKVGAVNCKYHNSFCYNSMRISSYPSLLFYPNGKNGNYIYFRGDRTLEALDQFVMSYLRSRIHVPTVTQLRGTEKPMAYMLGYNRVDHNALIRIAFHLNGLAAVVIVEDDNLREKLTSNEHATIVFKYKSINKEIMGTEEKDILQEIVTSLPKVTMIDPEKFKEIRNKLRSGSKRPCVLYFSKKGDNKLLLNQMKITFPEFSFGEIDCDKWSELCALLQVETPPSWGVVKVGGAYQNAPPFVSAADFIKTATQATRLHSLSPSDLLRKLEDEIGAWLLLIVPHHLAWDHIAEPFLRTSQHFSNNKEISFGILTCSLKTESFCRQLSNNQLTIFLQNGTRKHTYNGRINEHQLIEFIQLVKDSADMELEELQVLEILDASTRSHTWLVAHFPAHCGRQCDDLSHQWMLVAKKLRPLEFVRVGVLNCARASGGFCKNIRAPTARLYPLASGTHFSMSMQELTEAPYMLEWALERIDDSVQKLNWNTFTRTVIAEELNPASAKKPWLVYFHSPRCYRCYEMYADFAIAGISLNNAVHLGKVNCMNERGLCQHEQITSYPSLKLYLGRNQQQRFSTVISVPVRDHSSILQDIRPHLMKYDENILAGVDLGARVYDIKHDEF